jgi:hypothetical protein
MTPALAAALRELVTNPALTEALQTLSAALDEESTADRLAVLQDTCVASHELETLLSQIEALAVVLKKRPAGRH